MAGQSDQYATEQKAFSEKYNAELKVCSEKYNAELKASSEKYNAELKASSEKYNAELKASSEKSNAEQIAIHKKYSDEQIAIHKKYSDEQLASTNTENIAVEQKAQTEKYAATQMAAAASAVNADKGLSDKNAGLASSSALPLDIPWWPDLPKNIIKGISDYLTANFFTYKEYVDVSGEAAGNAAPALKDLVNRATKNTTLHYGEAMNKAWTICVENHPNADTETLLNCVNPY